MTSKELSEWIAFSIIEAEDAEKRQTTRGKESTGPSRTPEMGMGSPVELPPDYLFE